MTSTFKHINADEQIFDFSITSSLFAPGSVLTSIHADSNSNITGDVKLISGAGITLSQSGQNITVASTSADLPLAGGTMTGVIVYPVSINTSASGTVNPVAATGVVSYLYTVTGALTINGPTGGYDGQKITFRLLQDNNGHTVTFATGSGNFRFGTDIPSFTASGANKTDYAGVIWNSNVNVWDIVSVIQGF